MKQTTANMSKDRIRIYDNTEAARVRRAAQASAEVLQRLCTAVVPGMTTWDLDQLAAAYIKETGGHSAFLNYHGYPGQICVSLNEEVVHGIGRRDRVITTGDLVSIDVGVCVDDYVGDNARTVCAGSTPTGTAAALLQATADALEAGIAAALPGKCVNDISAAVEKVVKGAGFSVVRDLVGHGCGAHMHEPPEVPNYRVSGRTPTLRPGMILCIEPMVNQGGWRVIIDRQDKWTVRSADASLSAHFEHQILITANKPEVLTCLTATA